jgi:hypothetical protein
MPPAHSGVAAHHADPVLQRAQRVHGGLPFFGIVFCLRQLDDGVCASRSVTAELGHCVTHDDENTVRRP